jgi:GT2 family glycosyltransferase
MSSLRIVIVNWNTGGYLRRCLSSIEPAAGGGVELERVSVVDNASSDGSAEGLEDLDVPLEVTRNSTNVGFAAACNQGAEGSEAEYLLFLNPDTRLFADSLALAMGFMDSEEAAAVGICGGEMLEPNGAPAISCGRLPTLRVLLGKMTGLTRVAPRTFPSHHLMPADTAQSGPTEQVIGAFFWVRRELFERLGGFDTRYFIYYEEVDFSLRAARLGFGSYFLKEVRIVHDGNVSSDQVRDVRLYHSLRSEILYARRHWSRRQAAALTVLVFAVELPARLARALWRRSRSDLRETASAYAMLAGELRRGGPTMI